MTTLTVSKFGADLRGTERLRFNRIVRSEWTKLLSLRSTWVIGILFLAATSLLTSLDAASRAEHPNGFGHGATAMLTTMAPTAMTQIFVVILSALLVTSEYSTGTMQLTLSAVPRRTPVLAAKLIVAAVATLVLSVLSSLLSYAIAESVLAPVGLGIPITNSALLAVFASSALYLVGISIFCVAIAMIVRHSAAAIGISLGVLFILPFAAFQAAGAAAALGFPGFKPSAFILSNADATVTGTIGANAVPDSVWGVAVALVLWLAVPVIGAATLLRRRDA